MQIMKHGPVPINPPKRVPREYVPAMVTDRLDGRHASKHHALPRTQPRNLACQDEGEDVEKQSLEPVGVDCSVGVRDVEAVVLGVDNTVEGSVDVAETVSEVDPSVDDDESEEVL